MSTPCDQTICCNAAWALIKLLLFACLLAALFYFLICRRHLREDEAPLMELRTTSVAH
jgi:hypothetical protein